MSDLHISSNLYTRNKGDALEIEGTPDHQKRRYAENLG